MLIAIMNNSNLIKDADVEIMAKTIQIQLDLNLLPAWNLKSCTVKFYDKNHNVPGYAWIISITDNSQHSSECHSELNDKIDGYVFCKPILDSGGAVLYDSENPQNVTISSILSHEICEMVCDRFSNCWIDGPNGQYALEVCDPVENDFYQIKLDETLVSVSNFVFPAFFNQDANQELNSPFDFMRKLSTPFTTTPGGYMTLRHIGKTFQIHGNKPPHWKKTKVKKHRR